MAAFEHVGRRKRLDLHLVDLPRLQQRRALARVAVAGTHDPVGDVHVESGRKVGAGRVHIHQLGREVGIACRGGGVQHDPDGADHGHVLLERLSLKHDHVIATLQRQIRQARTVEAVLPSTAKTLELPLALIVGPTL